MKRVQRQVPLPAEMQGHWVEDGNVSSALVIMGGEISCFGANVEYDYKDVDQVDGALTVSLGINDEAKQDSFGRTNITGLVISPDGEFLVYNVKFGARFIRPGA
jgi:hypothetical protein